MYVYAFVCRYVGMYVFIRTEMSVHMQARKCVFSSPIILSARSIEQMQLSQLIIIMVKFHFLLGRRLTARTRMINPNSWKQAALVDAVCDAIGKAFPYFYVIIIITN